MSELKRCPFCGGEIKLMFLNYETDEPCVWDESIGNVFTWFRCYGCDTDFYHDEPNNTPQKKIEWFNTRIPMQNIVERLEEYHAENFYEENSGFIGVCIEIVKEEGGIDE